MTVVDIPGSKSITARALFLAAGSRGTTALRKPLLSDDSAGFFEGLHALGYRLEQQRDIWTVEGRPEGPAVDEAAVDTSDPRSSRAVFSICRVSVPIARSGRQEPARTRNRHPPAGV